MSLLSAFDHLFNLLAPALALAAALVLFTALAWRGRRAPVPWWWLWAVDAAVGCAVLLAGLWLAGSDGRIATYAALVLASATSHWLLLRAWRG